MIKIEDIQEFIDSKNYDIRVTRNGRWIDQKCTPDVVQVISNAIIEYCDENATTTFTTRDILRSDFARNEIREIFKKPDTLEYTAQSEYDKFFQQPMKMLSSAGILEESRAGRQITFEIKEYDILEHISFSERFSLEFIVLYIEKVLIDSDLYSEFSNFFDSPTIENFQSLKANFENFEIRYTAINKVTECRRIFTKVLNPLAYKRNSKGTKRGRLSKDIITKDMLMYNRNNFRDLYREKPKGKTRQQFIEENGIVFNRNLFKFQSAQAKKRIKRFNHEMESGLSQYSRATTSPEIALQMHHIFPEARYPSISGYVENIIALSPNEHLSQAHPQNNTSVINVSFQKEYLLIKADDIEHYRKSIPDETIYSFVRFSYVLSEGFHNDEIYEMENPGYESLVNVINGYYTGNE